MSCIVPQKLEKPPKLLSTAMLGERFFEKFMNFYDFCISFLFFFYNLMVNYLTKFPV